jgi:hypothetical protein
MKSTITIFLFSVKCQRLHAGKNLKNHLQKTPKNL